MIINRITTLVTFVFFLIPYDIYAVPVTFTTNTTYIFQNSTSTGTGQTVVNDDGTFSGSASTTLPAETKFPWWEVFWWVPPVPGTYCDDPRIACSSGNAVGSSRIDLGPAGALTVEFEITGTNAVASVDFRNVNPALLRDLQDNFDSSSTVNFIGVGNGSIEGSGTIKIADNEFDVFLLFNVGQNIDTSIFPNRRLTMDTNVLLLENETQARFSGNRSFTTVVPLPPAILMFISGLAGLRFASHRRT